MNNDIYDDIALEAMTKKDFNVTCEIKTVIARSIPTGHTTKATVFLTTKNQMFAYIDGRAPMTLGDVRKMVRRMGMTADAYLAPKGEPHYFDRIAEEKFKTVFPGRHHIDETELRFYRLLAPYNPALVRIAEVNEGVVNQFDTTDSSNWRPAAKVQFKKISPKA